MEVAMYNSDATNRRKQTNKKNLVAIHRVVDFNKVNKQPTLIYNKDGWCWLRYPNKSSNWKGYFKNPAEAESDARKKGLDPQAIYYPPMPKDWLNIELHS